MTSSKFFGELPYIEDIKEISSSHLFKDVPVDWYVLVTDIKSSTIAVEEGAYKEVNFIGACAITSIVNLDKQIEFPFVFGGDGATILIPPKYLEKAEDALRDTKKFAKEYFDLDLRIGAVPVIAVLRKKQKIKIVKLKVSEHYYQAIFMGGGLEEAENLVKQNKEFRIRLKQPKYPANYDGLQCVWQDIPSNGEEVVSLLIKASNLSNDTSVTYRKVLNKISQIYGSKENRFPVNRNSIRIRSNIRKIYLESLLESYRFKRSKLLVFLKNYLKSLFLSIRNGIDLITFNAYRKTVIRSIESEKFDDMLKMVISGTKVQTEDLMGFLDQSYKNGELAYGVHLTNSVHMTCFIFEKSGRQVHFIDGSNGGYTMASKELKNKIKWLKIRMQTI